MSRKAKESRGAIGRLWKSFCAFWRYARVNRAGSIISGLIVLIAGMFIQWGVVRWLDGLPSEAYAKVRKETQIALQSRGQRDCEAYVRMFARDSVVEDFRIPRKWYGESQIKDRCEQLPQFTELEHIPSGDPHMPTHGYPVLETDSHQNYVNEGDNDSSLDHHERWVFVKEDGEWKIKEFEFNLPRVGEER